VVSGNVWPELITVGTVMRPMVSDMKIYLSDAAAMVGSSNLTDGGLQSNREATILLDDSEEAPRRSWNSARCLRSCGITRRC
jgi:phosphatidylserine/phosphatidylglycerophosphate/cardiolipin synthase-like enzyme